MLTIQQTYKYDHGLIVLPQLYFVKYLLINNDYFYINNVNFATNGLLLRRQMHDTFSERLKHGMIKINYVIINCFIFECYL